jgi:surfactin synthase thioesterase subunit/phosphopantetheinyl transferase
VHLPGRAGRVAESPTIDVVALSRAISERANGRQFALFGHSMGAKLAFEVTRQLRRDASALPIALFVGGSRPPHMDTPLTRIARLSDDEFVARVVAMGGTPAGLLDNQEIRALILPAMRADFAMVEAYRFRPEPALPLPIVVLAGADDPEADPCDMTGWSAHTASWMRLRTFPGDHFFVHSARSAVLTFIAQEIANVHVTATEASARSSSRLDQIGLADLDDDEVLVVESHLDELGDLSLASGELSAGERRRAGAMSQRTDASRFVARTALLRRLLRTAGIHLGTGELSRAPGGKPAIAHRCGLRFNASHSEGRSLIAFSRGREVGVDVERISPTLDVEALAARGLDDDERAAVSCLAEDEAPSAILHAWTAKSAALKAMGEPNSVPLTDFGFDTLQRRPWRVESAPGRERMSAWRVYHLDMAGAVGALAVGPGQWRLRYEVIRGGDA